MFNRQKVAKIEIAELETCFRSNHDIDKFIDEYREFIVWLNDKYPSFKEDIKDDYWIKRIIKMHDDILVNLRSTVKDNMDDTDYTKNKEKTYEIYKG